MKNHAEQKKIYIKKEKGILKKKTKNVFKRTLKKDKTNCLRGFEGELKVS